MGKYKPHQQAFDEKIVKTNEGCWRWNGAKNHDGYAMLKDEIAHRWSYQRYIGPLVQGLEIDHVCGVRDCVNPKHLEQVTHLVNIRRAIAKGSYDKCRNYLGDFQSRKKHCKRGHPYSGDNLKIEIYKDIVARRCRTCEDMKFKKYKRSIREKETERT
jgi:hypothetical protein